MPTFNNVTNTSATPDPGFAFSAYATDLQAALNSLGTAAMTVATANPISQSITSSSAYFGYANGTTLQATLSSASSTAVVISHAEIATADGSSLDLTGSAKISMNSSGAISAGAAKLSRVEYGNDEAMQILSGAMNLDVGNGVLSGKITSITLAFSNDDPATVAHEWDYVTLAGKAGMSGSITGGMQSLSGKFASVQWGSMTTAPGGSIALQAEGAVSGLKIDAGVLLNGLNSSGFAALQAGMYSGNDSIDGTSGNDFLAAGTGNDKVYGEEGDDTIDGGAGNDQLFGGAGNDTISGGAGNDKITDQSGNNIINAGAGNDTIVCGAGRDWITGGMGADKITGGGGADVFVFDNRAAGGKDTLNDFNAAEDIFAFDTSVFTSLAGEISADNIAYGKVALDAADYLIFDTQGGKLYYDADGSGAGAAIQIATVKGALAGLSATNFADMDALLA